MPLRATIPTLPRPNWEIQRPLCGESQPLSLEHVLFSDTRWPWVSVVFMRFQGSGYPILRIDGLIDS